MESQGESLLSVGLYTDLALTAQWGKHWTVTVSFNNLKTAINLASPQSRPQIRPNPDVHSCPQIGSLTRIPVASKAQFRFQIEHVYSCHRKRC